MIILLSPVFFFFFFSFSFFFPAAAKGRAVETTDQKSFGGTAARGHSWAALRHSKFYE